MPVARFQLPDGKVARFEVPEGTSPEQAQAMIEREYPNLIPKQERVFGERLARQVGLTARAGVQGITAIPNMLGDVAGLKSSETVRDWLTKAGLPLPENATERVAQDVAGAMALGGGTQALGAGMAKAAGPVVSRVGDILNAQRGLQTVSAATGAGSAGMARESGVGPVGQIVAGVAGGMAPALVPAGAMSVRGLLRGGEAGRQRTAENIKLFREAGQDAPSVGQATEGRLARSIESTIQKAPGGAGPMAKSAEAGQAKIGARVGELADDIAKGATATKAGAAIEKGVAKFVDRFRGEQQFLYDKLDDFIPGQSRVAVSNVTQTLDDLTKPIAGAPALSKGRLGNAEVTKLRDQLVADAADGTLPYEALKQLRTRIGEKLSSTNLTDDIDKATWKRLYGALSRDMESAAKSAGPQAERAFNRANTYTRAGHERIDTYLNRVAGKDTVEKVFTAAVNPSEIKEGASTINAVMRSLPKDDRRVVQSAFLRRLGQAQAGKQGAEGEVFSTETFLTNWNKISPEAKMTLFADDTGNLRGNLDKVAKVAANLREGSRVFANPSGTQPAMSTQFASAWTLFAVLTGNVGIAATIGGAVLGANQTAKLMTNPAFVKWLAQSTARPTGSVMGQIATLESIARNMPPDEQDAVQDYIDAVKQTASGVGTQAPQQLRQGQR